MMRRVFVIALICACLLLLTSCNDRIDLEDMTLALTIGVDLDRNNQLLFSISSPVFSKEATKKTEEFTVRSSSMRYSRDEFDSVATALASSSKAQIILIGKRVLQHEDWVSLLDVLFRDAKSTLNAKVAIVNGPVNKYVNFSPKDKPRLPLHITKLINTADRRNITFKTSLARLHSQFIEKGVTPVLTELELDKSLKVTGTALLDHRGKYADKLLLQDSVLLHLLQDNKKGQMSITIPVPWVKNDVLHRNRMSFYVENVHRSIKTSYKNGKFGFKIKLSVSALLTERMFPFDSRSHFDQLQNAIKRELEKKCRQLITHLQKKKLDPIGLGTYARAYQYKAWKQVQDEWHEAISQADIEVEFDVKQLNNGLIK